MENSDIDKIYSLLNFLDKTSVNFSFVSGGNNHNLSIKSVNKVDRIIFKNLIDCLEYESVNESIYVDVIDKVISWNMGYINYQFIYDNGELIKKYCVTNNDMEIEKLVNQYEYSILNKKAKLYYFNLIDD